MKLWSRIHSMVRNLFRKEQVEIQLDEEVRASGCARRQSAIVFGRAGGGPN